MKKKISALFISLIIAPPLPATEQMPEDVQDFIEQRDTCDRFRGELPDPEEHERMREVNLQLKKFCRGSDRKLASLKKKYRSSAAVQRRLAQYEPQIESERRSSEGKTLIQE
ncbi:MULTISPECIES: hypothetical protein [unclassified Massilia]|uniref:hypothetical protein n=1 Tax=unclassified Massilia TaxID=2609279 RepID=UPI001B81AACD|nr:MULTISPECIES: hypothetical protein [unclassified Massilia]MBQ5941011.1 hypothetical protein [Massilia sp. AB1]MBQ5963801.1 hypothetical protein [Massilia sp. ZL223]